MLKPIGRCVMMTGWPLARSIDHWALPSPRILPLDHAARGEMPWNYGESTYSWLMAIKDAFYRACYVLVAN